MPGRVCVLSNRRRRATVRSTPPGWAIGRQIRFRDNKIPLLPASSPSVSLRACVKQQEDPMATWQPDPSFYPSPRMAAKAPAETIAYVAAFDPDRKTPDSIAVVDVDPKASSYSRSVSTGAATHAGDDFQHFRSNACS